MKINILFLTWGWWAPAWQSCCAWSWERPPRWPPSGSNQAGSSQTPAKSSISSRIHQISFISGFRTWWISIYRVPHLLLDLDWDGLTLICVFHHVPELPSCLNQTRICLSRIRQMMGHSKSKSTQFHEQMGQPVNMSHHYCLTNPCVKDSARSRNSALSWKYW